MKRFISLAMMLCVALTLSLDANAKRMGGGKSFGSAPTHQTRQATPPASQAAAPGKAAPAAAAAGGASRWLGPLAGLAAGGLLASMFMGGGFEGMQFFDLLIIGLIAFVIFRFIAARRRQQAGSQPASAGGYAPMQRDLPANQPVAPAANSIFGGSSAAAAAPVINAPSWFNEQRFVEAGKEHFMALQQHWDAAEMDKIAEFVTPQMLSFLKAERADLGDGFQSTYVEELQAQLDGIDELADKTVATLTFRGIVKTSRFDQGEAFSESWRMERANGENAPWLVAGIRQN